MASSDRAATEDTSDTRLGKPGQRLNAQVVKKVRELIMSGTMPGDSRLRTEHLAEELGVSATPVREALMALAGEGMVSFEPGRGFRVLPMSRQDVLDLYDVQAYLSGELAARAAVNLTGSGTYSVKSGGFVSLSNPIRTGATVNACARVLLKAGARGVDVAVVARTPSGKEVSR